MSICHIIEQVFTERLHVTDLHTWPWVVRWVLVRCPRSSLCLHVHSPERLPGISDNAAKATSLFMLVVHLSENQFVNNLCPNLDLQNNRMKT